MKNHNVVSILGKSRKSPAVKDSGWREWVPPAETDARFAGQNSLSCLESSFSDTEPCALTNTVKSLVPFNQALRRAQNLNNACAYEAGWLSKSLRSAPSSADEPVDFHCLIDVVNNEPYFVLAQFLADFSDKKPPSPASSKCWAELQLHRAASPHHPQAIFTTAEFVSYERKEDIVMCSRVLKSFPMPLGGVNAFVLTLRYHMGELHLHLALEEDLTVCETVIRDFGTVGPVVRLRHGDFGAARCQVSSSGI